MVEPGQQCTVWYETEEIKRSTDVYTNVLVYPTNDPSVTFAAESEGTEQEPLVINIAFGSRHRKNVDKIGSNTYRLRGTLTPFQHIELRWFKKASFESWVAEDSKKD